MNEPFSKITAEQEAKTRLRTGRVRFTTHARLRMTERDLTEQDVLNVVSGGWCAGHDVKGAGYTYRIVTQKMGVAVAFKGDDVLVVVTVFRIP